METRAKRREGGKINVLENLRCEEAVKTEGLSGHCNVVKVTGQVLEEPITSRGFFGFFFACRSLEIA